MKRVVTQTKRVVTQFQVTDTKDGRNETLHFKLTQDEHGCATINPLYYPPVTKYKAGSAERFHLNNCFVSYTPNGSVELEQNVWRKTGALQTWKTRPDEFSLPIARVKRGARNTVLTQQNGVGMYHTAEDCPLRIFQGMTKEQALKVAGHHGVKEEPTTEEGNLKGKEVVPIEALKSEILSLLKSAENCTVTGETLRKTITTGKTSILVVENDLSLLKQAMRELMNKGLVAQEANLFTLVDEQEAERAEVPGPTRIPLNVCQIALGINEGACNITAIADSLRNVTLQLNSESQGTKYVCEHPATRLILHQMAYLSTGRELLTSQEYHEALDYCVKHSAIVEATLKQMEEETNGDGE